MIPAVDLQIIIGFFTILRNFKVPQGCSKSFWEACGRHLEGIGGPGWHQGDPGGSGGIWTKKVEHLSAIIYFCMSNKNNYVLLRVSSLFSVIYNYLAKATCQAGLAYHHQPLSKTGRTLQFETVWGINTVSIGLQ